jgi:cytochrome c
MRTVGLALALILAAAPARADERGQRDYERYCVWCHGEWGNGRGPSAARFDPPPRDFTVAQFKCRTTPSGTLPTDADLTRSIKHGLHGAGMPAWATLGPIQIEDLIAYLKRFSPRWQSESVPAPLVVPPAPPASAEAVARGCEWFTRLQCAQCHGAHGEGYGPAAGALRDDRGNPIRLPDLTKAGAMKCGDSVERVWLTLMSGLDGTPMPSFAAALKPADAWDLARYILSLRR